MKHVYLFLVLISSISWSQPQMSLTPKGFDPVEVSLPDSSLNNKLIEVTKAWAQNYNRNEQGCDITEMIENSITISAFKRNAFFYRNRGETFEQKIRYTLKFTFYNNKYDIDFKVNDIYTDGNVLVKYKIPNYFTSEGKLKDGYEGLISSLEKTVNEIVQSHYDFLLNFK